MKVQELLEAISLIGEKDDVNEIIHTAIDKTMKFIYNQVRNEDIKDGKVKDHKTLSDRVDEYLLDDFEYTLKTFIMYRYGKAPYNLYKISFEQQMRADGMVRGSSMELNKSMIDPIITALTKSVQDSYGDQVFEEDGIVNYSALKDVFNNYKHINIIDQLVDKLTDTFVHELVHVFQHNKQTNRMAYVGSTEYRSYLTKNKKEFNEALLNLTSKFDWQIYHASPQEIPAFAHNMAISLINLATSGSNPQKVDNVEDTKFFISNLDDAIQDTKNYTTSKDYTDRYQEFGKDPKNRLHYQVYKRFMKLVYKEVMQYKEILKQRIHTIENPEEDW